MLLKGIREKIISLIIVTLVSELAISNFGT